jgi:CRISPR/Cas system-associated exonuclease Cas4 (RecB family)
MSMVAGVPREERAQIDAVQRRLAQKYAELPHDHVAAVVQHVYARFNQSTVRDYVPLLVERRAGEELTRSTAGSAALADEYEALTS